MKVDPGPAGRASADSPAGACHGPVGRPPARRRRGRSRPPLARSAPRPWSTSRRRDRACPLPEPGTRRSRLTSERIKRIPLAPAGHPSPIVRTRPAQSLSPARAGNPSGARPSPGLERHSPRTRRGAAGGPVAGRRSQGCGGRRVVPGSSRRPSRVLVRAPVAGSACRRPERPVRHRVDRRRGASWTVARPFCRSSGRAKADRLAIGVGVAAGGSSTGAGTVAATRPVAERK